MGRPKVLVWTALSAGGVALAAGISGRMVGSRLALAVELSALLMAVVAFFWRKNAPAPSPEAEAKVGEEGPEKRPVYEDPHLTLFVVGALLLGALIWRGSALSFSVAQDSPHALAMAAVALALSLAAHFSLRFLEPGNPAETGDFTDAKSFAVTLLREAELTLLFVATSLFLTRYLPWIANVASAALLAWTTLLTFELMARSVFSFFMNPAEADAAKLVNSPIRAFLLAGSHPLLRLKQRIKEQLRDDSRSLWALRHIAQTLPFLLFGLATLFWITTAITIVPIGELASVRRLGHLSQTPWKPGFHLGLPWPFDKVERFQVARMETMPLGFETNSNDLDEKAFLWTQKHSMREFSLVVGGETDLVVVNALIYFRPKSSNRGFIEYVTRWQNPTEALQTLAYRTLMEKTRSLTLDQVLSINRAAFASGIETAIQAAADQRQLGLNVTSVEVLSLHPPVEAAPGYLDVINARLDARRFVVESQGEARAGAELAQSQSTAIATEAMTDSLKRVSTAALETARFNALAESSQRYGDSFLTRLSLETKEKNYSNKTLYLIDHSLQKAGQEMWLDLRTAPQAPSTSRAPDSKSPTTDTAESYRKGG
jgi:regulator of protease activity HflC (stomatin/prohibitin superfamily)